MKPLERLFRILRRELWLRQRPYGLFTWHYAHYRIDPAIRLHRQIFFTPLYGLPRPLWWLLQTWLCLKWWLKAGHHAFLSERHQAKQHHRAFSWRHWHAATALAIAHSIPPASYYHHRLYERKERARIMSYLYDTEALGLHQLGAARDSLKGSGIDLLADKWHFTHVMREHDIEVADTTLVSRGPLELSPTINVRFLKPRFGSRSEGAFALYHDGKQPLRLRSLDGTERQGDDALTALQAHLCDGDYLCQPLLRNHPAFAALTTTDDALTLRVITLRPTPDASTATVLCAYLEVPLMSALRNQSTWFAIGVDLTSGKLLPPDAPPSPNLNCDLTLPHWLEAQALVIKAHRLLPQLRSIAWDLVLTPEGPVLLEGNFNWRLSTPQRLFGPFLEWAPELAHPWTATRTGEA